MAKSRRRNGMRASARSRDLERAGLSRTQIRRLVEEGAIERVGRGLYREQGAAPSERSDLAQAARPVPGAVVCLLSALRFHGLTTQNPFEVRLAIDRKAWRPRGQHPRAEVDRVTRVIRPYLEAIG